MNKEKIEQMLSSDNVNDVNLAGSMIKEHFLKITDEDLKTLYGWVDQVYRKSSFNVSRFEIMRQLLASDVHEVEKIEPSYTHIGQPYLDQGLILTTSGTDITTIPGDYTITNTGTTCYENK